MRSKTQPRAATVMIHQTWVCMCAGAGAGGVTSIGADQRPVYATSTRTSRLCQPSTGPRAACPTPSGRAARRIRPRPATGRGDANAHRAVHVLQNVRRALCVCTRRARTRVRSKVSTDRPRRTDLERAPAAPQRIFVQVLYREVCDSDADALRGCDDAGESRRKGTSQHCCRLGWSGPRTRQVDAAAHAARAGERAPCQA